MERILLGPGDAQPAAAPRKGEARFAKRREVKGSPYPVVKTSSFLLFLVLILGLISLGLFFPPPRLPEETNPDRSSPVAPRTFVFLNQSGS